MAWYAKYKMEWKNAVNQACFVEFQWDGSGATTAFTAGPTPAMLEYHATDKYQTVVGSSLTMELKYQSEVDDLFVEDDQVVRIRMSQGGTDIWFGYIVPGQYFRKFNKGTSITTVIAADQLGLLKNIKFESSSDPVFYQQTEMAMLSLILLKTGFLHFIVDQVNIYEDGFDSASGDSPFIQSFMYPEKYWDEITDQRAECYVVLTDILKKYGARIFQSVTQTWVLQRVNSLWYDHTQRVYNSAGAYQSDGTITPYVDVDDESYEWVTFDAELSKNLPVGRCELTGAPGRRASIIKNSSFEDFTWSGGSPRYWADSGSPTYNNTDTTAITMGSTENTSVPTEYVTCSMELYKPRAIRAVIEYKAVYAGAPTKAAVHFGFKLGANNYLTIGGWQNSPNFFWTQDMLANSKATMSDYEEIVIDFPPLYQSTDSSMGGDNMSPWGSVFTLEARLYEFQNENAPAANYVSIRSFRIEVEYEGSLMETQLFSYDNPVSTINNTKVIEISAGDSFLDEEITTSFDDIWWVGSSAAGRGNLLDEWFIKIDPTANQTIYDLFARQVVEGSSVVTDNIRAEFYIGSDVPFYHKGIQDARVVDSVGFVKTFMPLEARYNIARCTVEGSWVEAPAVYNTTTDADEWASENFTTATITDNSLEIDNSANDGFAYFETYTAIEGEIMRFVITLTDDGASALPWMGVTSNQITVAWGVNYIEYVAPSAGAQQIQIGNEDGLDTYNLTCEVDFYHMTGL